MSTFNNGDRAWTGFIGFVVAGLGHSCKGQQHGHTSMDLRFLIKRARLLEASWWRYGKYGYALKRRCMGRSGWCK